jgi:hypothetical protein
MPRASGAAGGTMGATSMSSTGSMPLLTSTSFPGQHTNTPPDGIPVVRPGAPRVPDDDTAVLTPWPGQPTGPQPSERQSAGLQSSGQRPPGPQSGMPPGRPGTQDPFRDPGAQDPFGGRVSGETLLSGISVVPQGEGQPSSDDRYPTPVPISSPADAAAPRPAQAAAKPAKKKGRSKVVLLGVAVIVAGGVAYGTGLVLNHSDVGKGTTVLGVDIGGKTREAATAQLDTAFGKRAGTALQLSVEGNTVQLDPARAGLTLDTTETVREASGTDYNPVSVIGSLFGQQRVVQPVMPVDEEKLTAALEEIAGGGSVTEGTIKFEPGRAVAVYGKAGQSVDAAKSATLVRDAYQKMVETGKSTPVQVAVASKEPTIDKAEVDRMMTEFAQPAMSEKVVIQADAAHTITFGPAISLPKILSVKAVDGKLTEVYDLKVLQELYGSTFDGVQVTTASGERAVLPQDVVAALRTALRGKTEAERVGVIETNGN